MNSDSPVTILSDPEDGDDHAMHYRCTILFVDENFDHVSELDAKVFPMKRAAQKCWKELLPKELSSSKHSIISRPCFLAIVVRRGEQGRESCRAVVFRHGITYDYVLLHEGPVGMASNRQALAVSDRFIGLLAPRSTFVVFPFPNCAQRVSVCNHSHNSVDAVCAKVLIRHRNRDLVVVVKISFHSSVSMTHRLQTHKVHDRH